MKTINQRLSSAAGLAFVLSCALVLVAACAKVEKHASFKTPQEAVDAFVTALQKDDDAELKKLLGPDVEDLLSSGDAVQDKASRQQFLDLYQAKHSLSAEDDGSMVLVVGTDDWPFPIPVVEHDGKWRLDGAAGADELVYRRVGRNELGAISVCRGFVAAENEYASEGRDGDPAGIYALKLISDEGMHNGLYWPTAEGETPSPAGPFVASAAEEGYRRGEGRTPYHGYYYRLLYAQGSNANGGAREYFKDGVMTEGFALVAWPADYGASGVQTFIVNMDGVVFQKDLGEDTATAVEAIKSFDPDSSWTAIAPEAAEAAIQEDAAPAT
jgi:hypothetical protein